MQASSVPCKRLFSGSKQTATDRRARLGSQKFEELQVLKSAWRPTIVDHAAANSKIDEFIDLSVYEDLMAQELAEEALDRDIAGDDEWPFDDEIPEVVHLGNLTINE